MRDVPVRVGGYTNAKTKVMVVISSADNPHAAPRLDPTYLRAATRGLT